jgi:hypothetical protein
VFEVYERNYNECARERNIDDQSRNICEPVHEKYEKRGGEQFYTGILVRYRLAAMPAFGSQYDETDYRQIIVPQDRAFAFGAA